MQSSNDILHSTKDAEWPTYFSYYTNMITNDEYHETCRLIFRQRLEHIELIILHFCVGIVSTTHALHFFTPFYCETKASHDTRITDAHDSFMPFMPRPGVFIGYLFPFSTSNRFETTNCTLRTKMTSTMPRRLLPFSLPLARSTYLYYLTHTSIYGPMRNGIP